VKESVQIAKLRALIADHLDVLILNWSRMKRILQKISRPIGLIVWN